MPGIALVERLIETRSLTNSRQEFVDLPRDFMYAGLLLRLSGTFTVAGGTTNGTLDMLNPWSYLDRIEVEGTGGGEAVTLKSYNGYQAARAAHLLRGQEPPRQAITSPGVQTGVAFAATVPVWFALWGANVPAELLRSTLLNPAQFSKLTLKITAGSDANFVRGGDRTETVNAPVVDIIALQAVNVGPLGSKPRKYRETYFLRDRTSAVATERRFSQPFPTGNRYRYVMLVTLDEESNAFVPVDDTLGDIRLQVGPSLIRRYTTPYQIVSRNKEENFVQDAFAPGGSVTAPADSRNPAIGFYMLDFMAGGRPEGLLDARNLPGIGVPIDLLHDVDIATARTVQVVLGEILG